MSVGGHAGGSFASPPSAWVLRWSALIRPGGSVLDVACGPGRHARLRAARGHPVLACDRDAAALAGLAGVAGLTTRVVDLEDGSPWPFPAGGFDAVVVTNYLHRPLFSHLAAALAPGGVLIYETFALGNERYGKPSNPAFLLRDGELLEAFGGLLCVAAFEQGRTEAPKAAMIQRICALRQERPEARLDGD